jgi:hypothetical protein
MKKNVSAFMTLIVQTHRNREWWFIRGWSAEQYEVVLVKKFRVAVREKE